MDPTPRPPLHTSFQPSAVPDSPAQAGCMDQILFAGAGLWVIGVTVLGHVIIWFNDQIQLIQGTPMPGWAWVLLSLGLGLMLALPVVPLALLARAPRLRAAYRTWALAIGYLALLGLARIFPVTWTQPAALAQIALSLLATGILLKLKIENAELRMSSANSSFSILNSQFSILAPALLLAPLLALPWLLYGALGSWLDTLLNLLAGLSLGLFAGVLLSRFLVAPLQAHSTGPGRDIAFGGFAAGVALLILGAGFGFGGTQLLLILCLPPLGFAAIGISRFAGPDTRRSWLPIAALVGLTAAAPLIFVDPDEFTLLLDDAFGSILGMAGLTFLLAWAVGLALWAAGRRINGPPRRLPALAGAAVAWAAALLVYIAAGQPGFYGERLFVILRDQADLSQAAAIDGREERLTFVYTTLTGHADTTQAGLRAELDRFGIGYQPYYLVNAIEVNGGPLLRAYLARRPEVERILDSPRLRPLPDEPEIDPGTPSKPGGVLWNITTIGADRVWNEFNVTGKGIVIGQSDSGVQGDHPALRDSYRGRDGQDDYNWLDPWNHTRAPTDIGGHGTHTIGTALGRGGIGVAPGAEWFGCVNLGRNLGNPALYLGCMQFMLAPYPQSGDPLKDGRPALAAHVINNSWGCPPLEGCDPGALAPAVSALRAAGIFVVASAGNDGPRCSTVNAPIAIYDASFSVGAIDEVGNVASFSSRGPVTIDGSGRVKPDIMAPGVDIVSSMPGSSYGPNDGTSMAGPHIVGVVALMWSAQPKLIGDIERTEQLLIETARPIQQSGEGDTCSGAGEPSNDYGYGMVDAYAAVKAALAEP